MCHVFSVAIKCNYSSEVHGLSTSKKTNKLETIVSHIPELPLTFSLQCNKSKIKNWFTMFILITPCNLRQT